MVNFRGVLTHSVGVFTSSELYQPVIVLGTEVTLTGYKKENGENAQVKFVRLPTTTRFWP